MAENIVKLVSVATIEIIPMLDKHIPHIVEIEQECFGQDAWSYGLFAHELLDKHKHYFVATVQGKVLGYGGYAQILDEAHIMNIAVRGLYRKRGIATVILERVFNDAQKRGIKAITLEVQEGNINAINLYQKSGFMLAGIRKKYYRNKYNALIYWRNL